MTTSTNALWLIVIAGGVGTFAVQIAKAYRAEVTGVCRTEKVDAVRSIGADHVVDYTEVNYADTGDRYDLILDAGAHQSVFASRRALAPGGRYVMVGGKFGPTLQAMALGPVLSRVGDGRVVSLIAEPNRADLETVAALLESGDVVPVDADGPGVGGEQAVDRPEERRLPRAVRADDADEGTGVSRERHAVENGRVTPTNRQILDVDSHSAYTSRRRSK